MGHRPERQQGLVDLDLDVDVLVNNAGFQHVAPIEEFPPEVFAKMHRVMVQAPFLLARAVLPKMYERGFGRVVNISSHLGIRSAPFKVSYVAAKHALIGISEVIALEGAPHGVTSNAICPTYARTPLVENQVAGQALAHGIPEGEVVEKIFLASPAIKRFATVEEVAELVAFLCTPAASFITAATYTLERGGAAAALSVTSPAARRGRATSRRASCGLRPSWALMAGGLGCELRPFLGFGKDSEAEVLVEGPVPGHVGERAEGERVAALLDRPLHRDLDQRAAEAEVLPVGPDAHLVDVGVAVHEAEDDEPDRNVVAVGGGKRPLRVAT